MGGASIRLVSGVVRAGTAGDKFVVREAWRGGKWEGDAWMGTVSLPQALDSSGWHHLGARLYTANAAFSGFLDIWDWVWLRCTIVAFDGSLGDISLISWKVRKVPTFLTSRLMAKSGSGTRWSVEVGVATD